MKKARRQGFWRPIDSQITTAKKKERRKRKSEEEERRRREKSSGCTLSFYNGYFGRKKMFDGSDLFGDNVYKNPARHKLG